MREIEKGTATPGQAWLEVREDALEWIAADRPEWRHGKGAVGDLNVGRIITDSGVHRMILYRVRDLQGVAGPAPLGADSIARLVSLGARERRVSNGAAFESLFVVVEPTVAPVEAVAP